MQSRRSREYSLMSSSVPTARLDSTRLDKMIRAGGWATLTALIRRGENGSLRLGREVLQRQVYSMRREGSIQVVVCIVSVGVLYYGYLYALYYGSIFVLGAMFVLLYRDLKADTVGMYSTSETTQFYVYTNNNNNNNNNYYYYFITNSITFFSLLKFTSFSFMRLIK